MALILMLAACGRHEQPAQKVASKPKRTRSAIPNIFAQENINPSEVFTVSRNGNLVTIQWNVDFSSCRGIRILRNPTGLPKMQKVVAVLPRTSKEHVDDVPEPRVYWYWLSIALPDGKFKQIGPLQAPADIEKAGTYGKPSEEMQFLAQRDGNSVVITWNLPDVKYKDITVFRNPAKEVKRKRKSRVAIHKTLEWHGDFVDQVPNADAQYWYLIEAIREDGSTVSKGPIKAEFGAR